jgi:UDP:flavonoid glycosyltransferase YjiC (YdhE family)
MRAHFGLIFPPTTSHITATTTVARELIRRGHQATAFNFLDIEERVRKEGVGFCPLGERQHPKGSVPANMDKLGRLRGLKFMRFGLRLAQLEIATLLEEGPAAMRERGVTALLVDQGEPAGSTLAELLKVPYVSICAGIHCDPDPAVPPPVFPWGPANSLIGQWRNRIAWRLYDKALAPIRRPVNQYRRSHGLKPLGMIYETFSPLLELTQHSVEFDFPRLSAPRQLHYIGLIRRADAPSVSFPFDRLDRRPAVYASLGTVHKSALLFRQIAEACAPLGLQLIITLGGNGDPNDYNDLPGSPIVVPYAPQHAVLKRASITVCHGGNNTVLESLVHGVPVLSIPVHDADIGVAARLRHAGAGDWIYPKRVTTARLSQMIHRLAREESYRQHAREVGASLERAGGERRAADLIEEKLNLSADIRYQRRLRGLDGRQAH